MENNNIGNAERAGKGVRFERIRRITGYLVGTVDRWNDAKKELEIGKRKGVFPGMKGKRTFNIVLVSPQSGVGISTSSSGVTVSYNGKATKLKIK